MTASGIVLPPPKSSFRRKALKKFTMEDVAKPVKEAAVEEDGPPPAKEPRLAASASGSALLSMLPPPKQQAPKAKALPAPVRLKPLELDAEGRIDSFDQPAEADEPQAMDFSRKAASAGETDDKPMSIVRPLSFAAKGKGKAVAQEAEVDFFGLGGGLSSAAVTASKPSATTTISAAPVVAPFRPPSPTPEDAYPGYYLHPRTKEWQAYDPTYYQAYHARWQAAAESEAAGGRAFEGVRDGREDIVDVSAKAASDVAGLPPVRPGTKAGVEVRIRYRKSVRVSFRTDSPLPLNSQPPKPKIIQSKAGRHNQLSALINNAKANREAIEEQIAKAKRNKVRSRAARRDVSFSEG